MAGQSIIPLYLGIITVYMRKVNVLRNDAVCNHENVLISLLSARSISHRPHVSGLPFDIKSKSTEFNAEEHIRQFEIFFADDIKIFIHG